MSKTLRGVPRLMRLEKRLEKLQAELWDAGMEADTWASERYDDGAQGPAEASDLAAGLCLNAASFVETAREHLKRATEQPVPTSQEADPA